MPRARRFIQCDVFTAEPLRGNGLAVVLDGEDLSTDEMQRFASWVNLPETTYLLPPETAEADYRLRIFTPARELPFAGHPTLGSAMAWRHAGGRPRAQGLIRQDCGIGVVEIDVSRGRPAFVAPPTVVKPMPTDLRQRLLAATSLPGSAVQRAVLLDNGSRWPVLELDTPARVLGVDPMRLRPPAFSGVGLIAAHPVGAGVDYEVRLLAPASGMSEDPVTGALNAALGGWLAQEDRLPPHAVMAQGTAMGRAGRVHLTRDNAGRLTVGGAVQILVEGAVTL